MNNYITPISSNQVIEVGLLKPKCASFTGNSLNDWLKWLAETECAVDWKSMDLTCIIDYIDKCASCEQDQTKVINLLKDAICKLITDTKITTELSVFRQLFPTTLLNTWASIMNYPVVITRQGKMVLLSGRIHTGTMNTVVYTLPLEYRPAYDQRILGINQANTSIVFEILTNGNITPTLGLTGVITSPNYISLDGITYLTNN